MSNKYLEKISMFKGGLKAFGRDLSGYNVDMAEKKVANSTGRELPGAVLEHLKAKSRSTNARMFAVKLPVSVGMMSYGVHGTIKGVQNYKDIRKKSLAQYKEKQQKKLNAK